MLMLLPLRDCGSVFVIFLLLIVFTVQLALLFVATLRSAAESILRGEPLLFASGHRMQTYLRRMPVVCDILNGVKLMIDRCV